MQHPHRHHRHADRERAFTLIEMIIVGAIMLILMGAAMMLFRGAKSTTYQKEAVTAGNAYVAAVAAYQADHANRNPIGAQPGAVPLGTNTKAQWTGPKNLLNKPYIASIPDSVTGGRTGVSWGSNRSNNCGTAKATPTGSGSNQLSWVSVCFGAPHGAEPAYGVRVLARKDRGTAWTHSSAKLCWLGNTAQKPRC